MIYSLYVIIALFFAWLSILKANKIRAEENSFSSRTQKLEGNFFSSSFRVENNLYYAFYTVLRGGIYLIIASLFFWIVERFYLKKLVLEYFVLDSTKGVLNKAEVLAQKEIFWAKIKNISSGSLDYLAQSLIVQRASIAYDVYTSFFDISRTFLQFSCFLVIMYFSYRKITRRLDVRKYVEDFFRRGIMFFSFVAVLVTVGIVSSLLFESLSFFKQINLFDFLFGLKWSPESSFSSQKIESYSGFGAVPLFLGSFMIAMIALSLSAPIGIYSALYLSEFAGRKTRKFLKPMLEILAGIPTVVYGFFAALTVAPFLKSKGILIGLELSPESAIAAGLVMGAMIIPIISSLSDDAINAVPQSLRDASYALGSTKAETALKVVFPAAFPGIVSAILLAISRAIGETMIVVMAAGMAANLTFNPLDSVTTVTVQIVAALVGDQAFDSPKTLSAFALGLVLFIVTMFLNLYSIYISRKYSERY